MKQLSFLFSNEKNESSSHEIKKPRLWRLFVDGASRNNPGPSGAGIVLKVDNEIVIKEGYYLFIKSNNQAEYIALLIGLYFFTKHASKHDLLTIYSDSQLLIRQLQGMYKVKNALLYAYYQCAQDILSPYTYSLEHILRERNTEADALANKGIDEKTALPTSFVHMMQRYEITI